MSTWHGDPPITQGALSHKLLVVRRRPSGRAACGSLCSARTRCRAGGFSTGCGVAYQCAFASLAVSASSSLLCSKSMHFIVLNSDCAAPP